MTTRPEDVDKTVIADYFAKLGLGSEVAAIYYALHVEGPQTISQLSRSSGVERTRIYRLINELMDSVLIEVETDTSRGIMKAAPIANLRILISKREQELQSLQDELHMVEQVLARSSLSSPATRVQFYKGAAGIKQIFWNETRAESKVDGLLYENMQNKAGNRFFERWVTACNNKNLQFRGIIADSFSTSQQAWYGDTVVKQRLKNWETRQINQIVFPIAHSTIVYDNVTVHFNWKQGEMYGIEIYNSDIAAAQRAVFELLWNQAVAAR